MDEYYLIEATLSTGASKWLIVRVTDSSGLVIHEKYNDKVDAMGWLEYLNRGE